MNSKTPPNGRSPLDKSNQEKNEEAIDIFKYFENVSIRNRDAFCELLDYTMENKRDPHKSKT